MNEQEIQKLQKEVDNSKKIIAKQQAALDMMLADQEEKEIEIQAMLEKRQDVQMEFRAKHKVLQELNDQYNKERMLMKEQEQMKKAEQKLEKKRKNSGQGSDFDGTPRSEVSVDSQKPNVDKPKKLTIEDQFKELEAQTQMTLKSKAAQLKNLALKNLRSQLFQKFTNIQEKPIDILKRVSIYTNLENNSGIEQPQYSTVLVKVLQSDVKEMHYSDSDQDDEGNKTLDRLISKKKDTPVKGKKKKQTAEEKEKEFMQNQKQDPLSPYFKYKFYSETFRISKNTDAKMFLRIICEFWGLDLKKFEFYDDNGESIELETLTQNSGGNLSIEKVVNSCMSKELKIKDLLPDGPRQITLYVGEMKQFETKFKKYIKCKEKKLKEIKDQIDQTKLKNNPNNLENPEEEEEEKEDIQETFLQQFPGLSGHYSRNKLMFKKDGNKPGFDIKYGNWIAPSCCSLLVNFIQWMLTFSSIMLYKGDGSGFWLPELIRADLEDQFRAVSDQREFWNFTQNTLGEYLYNQNELILQNGGLNWTNLNDYNKETYSDNSKGRLFVGPVRWLQKRVKSHPCKRATNVERYKKYFQNCYQQAFTHHHEDKTPFSDRDWGKYWDVKDDLFRFTESREFLHGHFGDYYPHHGYKYDFHPFDLTLFEYDQIIQTMKMNGYITLGATKSVSVQFCYMFPSSTYFVSVSMLFEFSAQGQVIPTRFEAMPFKLSAFAYAGDSSSKVIDLLKFLLVIYTFYSVMLNFQSYKTMGNLFSWGTIADNFVDLAIIFLQTYCFALKLQDARAFNIIPSQQYLTQESRNMFYPCYYIARNFRDFCIMETIGLVFVLFKVVDGARLIQRFNVIIMTLIYSINLMIRFLILLIVFNAAMTPLAQAIWGTYLLGYKTFVDSFVSVLLIAYSKGNLEELLDLNLKWAFLFILMYYSVAIFLLHAAFHQIQTDAVKNIVLLNSLKEDDVLKPPIVYPKDLKEFQRQQRKMVIEKAVRALQWLFGWLPRGYIKKIADIGEIFQQSDDEDDREDIASV